jgi:hypothetical protein
MIRSVIGVVLGVVFWLAAFYLLASGVAQLWPDYAVHARQWVKENVFTFTPRSRVLRSRCGYLRGCSGSISQRCILSCIGFASLGGTTWRSCSPLFPRCCWVLDLPMPNAGSQSREIFPDQARNHEHVLICQP